MFTCELNPASRVTLYDQLYEALRIQILQGGLPAGTRLPSKRELAAHLSVSTATVEAAYGRLTDEGYCESRPRSGMYVCAQLPDDAPPAQRGAAPIRWDFSTGTADAGQFPYAAWARLMREVLSEQNTSLLRSGDPQGDEALRVQIAGMLRRMRGIEAKAENIVLGAGTEVLTAALVALIGRERLFAVEDPGYSRIRRVLVTCGARISPTPLSGGAIDVRALYLSGAGAACVTPSHQFPTGHEMDIDRRAALLRWARETGAYILEDDYDSEFRFFGRGVPALAAMDGAEQVVYMNTFSRTLAPGLRLSFMLLPDALVPAYRKMHASCSVSGFEQETLRKFIAGGHLERHIARMRVIYRGRLQAMEKAAAPLGTFAYHGTGLHALLDVGGHMPAGELIPRAAQEGVRLSRLCDHSVMSPGQQAERVVLLGFAGMDEAAIAEGMAQLQRAWR
ncbi:MAG: PLP-dependent aminotransferase family protein [Clostridia bacterium]|nr:PLP-dependent aminotransferase family protein [Clostridia bacterium]